jgi:MoaA/NifB/PqqE/SkfB family radical SAM enzyme
MMGVRIARRATLGDVLPRLDLKVGFACNNRCRFCVQGDKRARFAPKSSSELRACLAQGRPALEAVVFTGGEPTLRQDLPELVAHARALGYRQIQIQTNGRMLAYRRVVERLVASGVTEFSPALHAPCAAVHDGLTRAEGSFDQTVAGIRNLAELGVPVLTNSVITRSSYPLLEPLAELLVELAVGQMQFAFVHPVGSAAAELDAIVPRLRDVAPHLKRALDIGRKAGRRVMAEAVPYCMLAGYEDCVAEEQIPPTVVVDAEITIADYGRYRRDEGKRKGPACASCAYDARCEGPWREYPDRFGFDELRPVAQRAGELEQ